MAVFFVLFGLLSGFAPVQAQEEVVWPQVTLVRRYGGFNLPLNFAFVDDGTGRVFVGEHAGPVSYTHLDVYKRQGLSWPARR